MVSEAMAEPEGARSTGKQGRIALKELTQSPGRYLLLSPNDDSFERRQARLARQKRRSLAFGDSPGSGSVPEQAAPGILTKSQVLELLNNCIKLAAENKINQQNTWDLKLIDYLPELVKADIDEDTQTNFQKASCTLEASAKIYSCRVDSVHTETYKVLGGLHRTAAPGKNKHGGEEDAENVEERTEEQEAKKKDSHKKTDRASTLETFENLNLKQFDVTLNVDPLFHQTSAQFDEGGAKGLLLNTLSVYRGCEILFDSLDVPEKCMSVDLPKDPPTIDLSFVADVMQEICSNKDREISPSLSEIVKLLDNPLRKAAETEQTCNFTDEDTNSFFNDEFNDNNTGEVFDDPEERADYFPDEGNTSPGAMSYTNSPEHHDEGDFVNGYVNGDSITMTEEDTIDWLKEGMGIPTKRNAWAGADYWKFVRPKGDTDVKPEKVTKKKKEPFSLVYTKENIPEFDTALFAKPRDLRANLLPQSRQTVSTTLPEDLRYKADDLLRLFLRPSVMCVGGRLRTTGRVKSKESPSDAWDGGNDGIHGDFWAGDDNGHSDIEDNGDELITQPRKVKKIEVDYDKTSKVVDVRALKESIWESIQVTCHKNDDSEHEGIQFSDLLGKVPEDSPAPEDELSVHLCFICLLHLANEHGLVIKDCPTMNELLVFNVQQQQQQQQQQY